MDLATLKRLRADLTWIRDDPDGDLTEVQAFHAARALRTIKAEIAAIEAIVPTPLRPETVAETRAVR